MRQPTVVNVARAKEIVNLQMIPAEICRAALCEAGRPDLAFSIGTNKVGHPIRQDDAYSLHDAELVAKAIKLSNTWVNVSTTELTLMLQSPIIGERLVSKHWSPRLNQWVDLFDIYDWNKV